MVKKVLFFLFFVVFVSASAKNNFDLLGLNTDQNWNLIHSFDDSVKVYKKPVLNKQLNAYRVVKQTDLDPEQLYSVFEDIKNYEQALPSANNIDFEFVSSNQDTIYGYQHIKINVPFVKDRHYVYRMLRHNPKRGHACWVLRDQEGSFKDYIDQQAKERGKPIYLSDGVGVFKVEPEQNTSQYTVSYSLYMDPGGNLPDFLINMINERGLVNMFRDVLKEAKRISK